MRRSQTFISYVASGGEVEVALISEAKECPTQNLKILMVSNIAEVQGQNREAGRNAGEAMKRHRLDKAILTD